MKQYNFYDIDYYKYDVYENFAGGLTRNTKHLNPIIPTKIKPSNRTTSNMLNNALGNSSLGNSSLRSSRKTTIPQFPQSDGRFRLAPLINDDSDKIKKMLNEFKIELKDGENLQNKMMDEIDKTYINALQSIDIGEIQNIGKKNNLQTRLKTLKSQDPIVLKNLMILKILKI